MSSAKNATYLLKQDGAEACRHETFHFFQSRGCANRAPRRLASQHLVWQLHTGYSLHPKIEVRDGMTIADLGTGTGIWALQLAPSLLPNSKIVGYDISDAHLPHKEYWPSNAEFGVLDSMKDVPESLEGQFDVVHIRMWAYIPRENDPSPLIRHAAKLLSKLKKSILYFVSFLGFIQFKIDSWTKLTILFTGPGGYLQWEDARFGSFVTRGDAACEIRNMLDRVHLPSKLDFQWLEELDQHVQSAGVGFEVLDAQYGTWAPHLRPLAISNTMLAMQNLGAALDGLKQKFPSIPSQAEWLNSLEPLDASIGKLCGGQLYWPPVTLLARKYSQA
ncbi:hypothetical protein N7456_011585 [Penicillium angulare]|uniref:Methyltransferase domain-containing protein n=1 Tax=Penicillium angulare TaxID=116970 RepID=A0A9W9EU54_9EURO|nr:hypothetical protein N7456_011585 [Penicillium angulare]